MEHVRRASPHPELLTYMNSLRPPSNPCGRDFTIPTFELEKRRPGETDHLPEIAPLPAAERGREPGNSGCGAHAMAHHEHRSERCLRLGGQATLGKGRLLPVLTAEARTSPSREAPNQLATKRGRSDWPSEALWLWDDHPRGSPTTDLVTAPLRLPPSPACCLLSRIYLVWTTC